MSQPRIDCAYLGLTYGTGTGVSQIQGFAFPSFTLHSPTAGQWYLDGEPIIGETSSTYVVRLQDIGKQLHTDGQRAVRVWHPGDVPQVASCRVAFAGLLADSDNPSSVDGSIFHWYDLVNRYAASATAPADRPVLRETDVRYVEFSSGHSLQREILERHSLNNRRYVGSIAAVRNRAPQAGSPVHPIDTETLVGGDQRFALSLSYDSSSSSAGPQILVTTTSDPTPVVASHTAFQANDSVGRVVEAEAHFAPTGYVQLRLDGTVVDSTSHSWASTSGTDFGEDSTIGGIGSDSSPMDLFCLIRWVGDTRPSDVDMYRLRLFAKLCMGASHGGGAIPPVHVAEIYGDAFPGERLESEFTGQWYLDGSPIPGSSGKHYDVTIYDIGKDIYQETSQGLSNTVTVWHPYDVPQVHGCRVPWLETYTSTAGGTGGPVASEGDPVGTWNNADTTGDLTAPNSTSRPTLRVSAGGYRYLEFDGTNSYFQMSSPERDIPSGRGFYGAVVAAKDRGLPGSSALRPLLTHHYAAGGQQRLALFLTLDVNDPDSGLVARSSRTANVANVVTPPRHYSADAVVLSAEARYLDGFLRFTVDNEPPVDTPYSDGAGLSDTSSGDVVRIGRHGGGYSPLNLYCFIQWSGDTPPSDHELSRLRRFAQLCIGEAYTGEDIEIVPDTAIQGDAFPGNTLTSPVGGHWYVNDVLQPGGPSFTYVVSVHDMGYKVRCDNSYPVTVWSPADVAGTISWRFAGRGVRNASGGPATDGEPVQNWIDELVGYSLTQGTPNRRPTLSVGAFDSDLPGVVFDGINDSLSFAASEVAQLNEVDSTWTFFAMRWDDKPTSTATLYQRRVAGSSGNVASVGAGSTGIFQSADSINASAGNTSQITYTIARAYAAAVTRDYAGAGQHQLTLNQVRSVPNSYAYTGPNEHTSTIATLAAASNTDQDFTAATFSLVIHGTTLPTADDQDKLTRVAEMCLAADFNYVIDGVEIDPDARTYFNTVEMIEGGSFASSMHTASQAKLRINQFILDLKAAGAWDAIVEYNLLCGVNFEALPARLKRHPATPVAAATTNFSPLDYTPTGKYLGLANDGSVKHINASLTTALIDGYGGIGAAIGDVADGAVPVVIAGNAGTTGAASFTLWLRRDGSHHVGARLQTSVASETSAAVEFPYLATAYRDSDTDVHLVTDDDAIQSRTSAIGTRDNTSSIFLLRRSSSSSQHYFEGRLPAIWFLRNATEQQVRAIHFYTQGLLEFFGWDPASPEAPAVTHHPEDTTFPSGITVQLESAAVGSPPPASQWETFIEPPTTPPAPPEVVANAGDVVILQVDEDNEDQDVTYQWFLDDD